MRKYSRTPRTWAAIGAVITLGAAAACGAPPEESKGGGDDKAKEFKACIVSDSGGFDDKSFNETSYKGLQDAEKELGIKSAKLESKDDNTYPKNINSMVQQKCNVIVTVGFKLGDATYNAAKKNPNIDFTIVDYGYDPKKQPPLKNLKPLQFNTAQPSFLAGYLAAGMSKTGTVGTFGGEKIPTVTIFMDGYYEGVQYYNQQKKKNVKVVGWNEDSQAGVFTGTFEDANKGKNSGTNLISQGADVIFPVAGPAGSGGLAAAKESNGKVNAIWVDADGCETDEQYCPQLYTSVLKGMDVGVQKAITDSYNKKFDNTPYIGTLKDKGVDLAPFHEWDSKVPASLKKEIETIRAGIEGGSIPIKSKSQPK